MCELLGMSSNIPTDISFSFTGLVQRGGNTGPHRDGWGTVYFEGPAARIIKETTPSATSALAKFMQEYQAKSNLAMAHIRRANRGKVCLENTHPFVRELWGRPWVFAHNGQLKGIKKKRLKFYKPIGTTDSEHAFCWLLDQIRERFPSPPKSCNTLYRFVEKKMIELDQCGVLNCLLSEGNFMLAFCSTRMSLFKYRAPFGELHLIDVEMSVDLNTTLSPDTRACIVATAPLTKNADWIKLPKQTFLVLKNGGAYCADGSKWGLC